VSGARARGAPPLTTAEPFRIASTTKPFVAATVLRLVERDRIGLMQPIGELVSPETAASLRAGGHDPSAIRLRHLLEHTAGLPDHAQMQAYVEKILANPAHRWTAAEQIALAMDGTRPLAAPGELFSYSDTGYVILGEIVERATGKPLAAAVRTEVLAGAGLASTWWERAEPAPRGAAAPVHQYLGTVDTSGWDPSFDLFGGGGIISTTPDLARWYRHALTGKLFTAPQTMAAALARPNVKVKDERLVPHAPLMHVTRLGQHSCWGHGGFWGTIALYCPGIDVAVAVTVNVNTAGANTGLKQLLDGIAEELAKGGVR
jgi:D-alanyl-D-alanine carboxypeptidase